MPAPPGGCPIARPTGCSQLTARRFDDLFNFVHDRQR
jgi:hypothetical protein